MMNFRIKFFAVVLAVYSASSPSQGQQIDSGAIMPHPSSETMLVGLRGCVEGFVMDFFCIERGTLLDQPSVVTLEGPEQHSVHCLIDVRACISTPFELLLDPSGNETEYARGWRLDDATKDLVAAAARQVGVCSDCDGTGTLQRGFRVAMNVTVLTMGSASVPPVIGNAADLVVARQGENICTADTALATASAVAGTTGSNMQTKFLIHGSLMLISWGWILPSGVLFARFFKHRPAGVWFKIHRVLQLTGMLCAIIGWVIALRNFNSLLDKGMNTYRHGVLGCTTMVLGLIQPINACLRPHATEPGEVKTPIRFSWELVHKGLGYVAILLAIVTIGYGTTLLQTVELQRQFQIAYGAGVGGILVLLTVVLLCDKAHYHRVTEENDVSKSVRDGGLENQNNNSETLPEESGDMHGAAV